jgi:hypothetical protein
MRSSPSGEVVPVEIGQRERKLNKPSELYFQNVATLTNLAQEILNARYK